MKVSWEELKFEGSSWWATWVHNELDSPHYGVMFDVEDVRGKVVHFLKE